MIDDPSAEASSEQPGEDASTGDARVDAAIRALGELDALPVSEHVEQYADVHTQLQDILNEVGSPASPGDRSR